jgi:peroxiredoxin
VNTANGTIAEQVRAMEEGTAAQMPAEVLSAFGAEQAQLAAAGVPSGAARAGTVMPDGDLLDAYGAATTLGRVRNGKPAVVVFYRGAWCPFCDIALRTYQRDLVPELARRGVEMIAISPQTPDGSLSTKATKELTFSVLSDPGNQVAGQLGILTAPTEEVKEAQAKLGLDLTAVNADGSYGLPMPTVAIVDDVGTIRWIDIHPNYATRTEPGDILAALASATG